MRGTPEWDDLWPRLMRLLCRVFGHRWEQVARAPALGAFFLCRRCGRWFRA